MTDYLQKSEKPNVEYQSNILCQLKEALKEKQQRKLQKVVLFLQESAPAHRTGKTMDVLKDLWFECINHPPYSPDLAPS